MRDDVKILDWEMSRAIEKTAHGMYTGTFRSMPCDQTDGCFNNEQSKLRKFDQILRIFNQPVNPLSASLSPIAADNILKYTFQGK